MDRPYTSSFYTASPLTGRDEPVYNCAVEGNWFGRARDPDTATAMAAARSGCQYVAGVGYAGYGGSRGDGERETLRQLAVTAEGNGMHLKLGLSYASLAKYLGGGPAGGWYIDAERSRYDYRPLTDSGILIYALPPGHPDALPGVMVMDMGPLPGGGATADVILVFVNPATGRSMAYQGEFSTS